LKKCGEIDVVAKKADLIHFVEVKTVSHENVALISHETNGYRAEDNIHFNKLARLKRVIQIYLVEKYISEEWQFHAITVLFDAVNREARVEFLENLIL
jgi:Holliday junction resolvase-like predicted endonuclease